MIKKLILIVGILFLVGCVEEKYIPQEDKSFSEENGWISAISRGDYGYTDCDWNFYEIEYVDEILSQNCYAFVNNKYNREYEMRKSLEKYGINIREYFFEKGFDCDDIYTEGKAYCLRDNSTCMILEEDGICDIVSLK